MYMRSVFNFGFLKPAFLKDKTAINGKTTHIVGKWSKMAELEETTS